MDLGYEADKGEQRAGRADSDFLKDAIEQAEVAYSGWEHIHQEYKRDVLMASGEQWDQATKADREDAENPRIMLTLNQFPKYIRQVIGDARQNRLQIKCRPVEGDRGPRVPSQTAGSKDYSLAEVMEGLIRNIEYRSKAERAYDTALSHAVTGGIGWLRVIKRYSRPNGFEQELCIRAPRNPLSVMLDPLAIYGDEPDMAGASFGVVTQSVRRSDLVKRFGKDAASIGDASLPGHLTYPHFWARDDQVTLLEYYSVDSIKVRYLMLSDGRIVEEPRKQEEQIALHRELEATGIGVVRDRYGEKRRVRWSLLSCHEVLEGPYLWDGGHIPLVPVTGPEILVDDRMHFESLIRHSHDAQRNVNYWMTAAAERVALAPKAPWLADYRSVQGFEKEYALAQRKPIALLKYRGREGVQPPKREFADVGGAPEIAMALQSNDQVQNTIGLYNASLGAHSNETSGRAINARDRQGDTGTFQWHDALAKGVERVGVILADMIPSIYDTERVVRLRFPEDVEDMVAINQVLTSADGTEVKIGDLAATTFDVTVSAGPSFATRRQEAAESMMGFVQAFPQAAPAVGDLVATSMDWPNADSFAKRLKKMVPPELLEPSELEEMQANAPPPDPAQQAAAEAQAQMMQAETQANVTTAEAKRIEADAKLASAQALEPERVKELVAEAIAEVLPALLGQMPNQGTNP